MNLYPRTPVKTEAQACFVIGGMVIMFGCLLGVIGICIKIISS